MRAVYSIATNLKNQGISIYNIFGDIKMKKKIIHMVTLSGSIVLMDGQLQYLMNKGYDVGVVSSPGEKLEKFDVNNHKAIPMARNINPIKDLVSLSKLILYFQKEKPNLINAGTPKAGLLGILASFITNVPQRIYTLRGLRLETETGLIRKVLWLAEKIACTFATEVICVAPSLLSEARKLNLIKSNKGIVLGNGSSNGIQLSKYPDRQIIEKEITKLSHSLGLEENTFIMGFVGRLTKDKGIEELISSFKSLQEKYSDIKLLILGRIENQAGVSMDLEHELISNSGILYLGFVEKPELYYYLMDVLIFPTYREGFGNVSIQAQAAGTPVIVSDVTGAKDTIINNETGFLVPVKSVKALVESVEKLKSNPELRQILSDNAKEFVRQNFDSKIVWEEINKLYKDLLK